MKSFLMMLLLHTYVICQIGEKTHRCPVYLEHYREDYPSLEEKKGAHGNNVLYNLSQGQPHHTRMKTMLHKEKI